MKKILLTGMGLLIIVVGGVYLAQRSAPSINVATGNNVATTTAPGSGAVTVPQQGEVTLALGESASFQGALITPISVEEDSRCPAGVYCIQAGTVRVKLEIVSPVGTFTKTVKLGDTVTIGTKKLTFTKVDPLKTQTPIDPKQYRFTASVENAA